jgi:hypothetical protein
MSLVSLLVLLYPFALAGVTISFALAGVTISFVLFSLICFNFPRIFFITYLYLGKSKYHHTLFSYLTFCILHCAILLLF